LFWNDFTAEAAEGAEEVKRDNFVTTEMLHHCQQQARCLFHKTIYLLWNRHLACS